MNNVLSSMTNECKQQQQSEQQNSARNCIDYHPIPTTSTTTATTTTTSPSSIITNDLNDIDLQLINDRSSVNNSRIIKIQNNNQNKMNNNNISSNNNNQNIIKMNSVNNIPKRRELLMKILMDSMVLVLLFLPIVLMYKLAQPFKRGFHCDDDSIRYPLRTNTISSNFLFFYAVTIPLLTICINEYIIYYKLMYNYEISKLYFLKNYLWQLYQQLIPFIFAFLSSQFITDISKYSIGRLRPHFLDVCHPIDRNGFVYDRLSNCSQPNIYVMDFNCTKNLNDAYRLKDARLSFMSGHSSFAAVTLMYLVFYIQYRMKWQNLNLFKPLYQYLLICLIFYTGFTRISDYKHHWSDVLIGIIQGTMVAIITSLFISNFRDNSSKLLIDLITNSQNNTTSYTKLYANNGNISKGGQRLNPTSTNVAANDNQIVAATNHIIAINTNGDTDDDVNVENIRKRNNESDF